MNLLSKIKKVDKITINDKYKRVVKDDDYERVVKDLKEALERNRLRKQNIIDLAIKDALIFKLGDFKLKEVKDKVVCEVMGNIMAIHIEGALLLAIEDNDSLAKPRITKFYKNKED